MRNVLLLGASGSIGNQTLDLLQKHQGRFRLNGFSLGKRVEQVGGIIKAFPSVRYVCVSNEQDAWDIQQKYPFLRVFHGDNGLLEIIQECPCDMVVNALVGFVGLLPSIASLKANKILCLANKESLVVGGTHINRLLAEGHGILWPIDSEHVAVAKLLRHVGYRGYKRVWITASGGSFRNRTRAELANVTPEDALAHPTWSMGAKITIDSATMMNKGFELIEADVLFGIGLDKVSPLMHDESYVHSALELDDGSFLCDISKPDMHGPIEFALLEGEIEFEPVHVEELSELENLHFHDFDPSRYPAVTLALKSHARGGNSNAILNAANEGAVYAFLEKRIPFLQIEEEVRYALESVPFIGEPTVEELVETDCRTRRLVEEHIKER